MLASIVALPMVVILAFYASLNVNATNGPLFGNFGFGSGISNLTEHFEENLTAPSSNGTYTPFPNFFPNLRLPSYLLTALIIIVLIILSVFLVRGLRLQSALLAGEFSEEDLVEKQRNEVADILDRTAFRLRQGEDYRQTVLECYRRICENLEERYRVDGRPLTAREFETSVSILLKLNSPYLSRVTDIFELARYSLHDISRDDADAAIDCLTNLSTALRVGVKQSA